MDWWFCSSCGPAAGRAISPPSSSCLALSSSSDSNEYGAHPINAEEVVEPKVEPPAPATPKTSTRNKEMTIPQRTVCVSRVPAKTFNSSMPFLDKKIPLEQSHNAPIISGVPVCLIEEFIIYRVHQPNIPTSTINKIKRNPTRESSRSVSWLMKRICSTKSITTKSWRR